MLACVYGICAKVCCVKFVNVCEHAHMYENVYMCMLCEYVRVYAYVCVSVCAWMGTLHDVKAVRSIIPYTHIHTHTHTKTKNKQVN